jgi:hypothetical protein
VSGAWVFALLQQSEQIEKGRSGELCAGQRNGVSREVGGLDGNAKTHEVAIDHDDMAGVLRRMTDRQDLKASAEQRMGWIGYFDLIGRLIRRVLEQGIVLPSRLTTSTTISCCEPSVTLPDGNSSSSGLKQASWKEESFTKPRPGRRRVA